MTLLQAISNFYIFHFPENFIYENSVLRKYSVDWHNCISMKIKMSSAKEKRTFP